MINTAYKIMLWSGAAFMSVSMLFCLARGVLGPRFTDRLVSVNLIGSKTIVMIAILSFLLEEGGLVDIAMVYALISFVAIIVLSKCYISPNHPNPANAGRGAGEASEENDVYD